MTVRDTKVVVSVLPTVYYLASNGEKRKYASRSFYINRGGVMKMSP